MTCKDCVRNVFCSVQYCHYDDYKYFNDLTDVEDVCCNFLDSTDKEDICWHYRESKKKED